MPDHELARARRDGVLEPVQPGVWRVIGAPPTYEQASLAALLASGPGAVLSHRSAAQLLGLGEAAYEVIDVSVPRERNPRLRGVVLHRSLDLATHHVTHQGDLTVTTVERTLADLGDVIARPHVGWAVEHAIIGRRTTIGRLWVLLDELGRQGRNGRGALREALEGWLFEGRQPDSVLEVMLARVVHRFGLPTPEYQAVICAGGRFVARVDACWHLPKVVVEVDGFHAHAAPERFQHDLRRQNELVALGYRVLRFTWRDVVHSPGRVAALIAAELPSRRAA